MRDRDFPLHPALPEDLGPRVPAPDTRPEAPAQHNPAHSVLDKFHNSLEHNTIMPSAEHFTASVTEKFLELKDYNYWVITAQ